MNGTTPPIDAELEEDVDDAPARVPPRAPTKKELDEVFAKARAIAEPVIEIVFLGSALAAAVTTTWNAAKKKAAARAKKGR